MNRRIASALFLSIASMCLSATAAEKEFKIIIKDHQFLPSEARVPAGEKVKLIVHNQDKTPEEFESHALNREKVIPGGATAIIFIGPLKPGKYEFEGEFHAKTAKGIVIAE
jgi:plastocyanin